MQTLLDLGDNTDYTTSVLEEGPTSVPLITNTCPSDDSDFRMRSSIDHTASFNGMPFASPCWDYWLNTTNSVDSRSIQTHEVFDVSPSALPCLLTSDASTNSSMRGIATSPLSTEASSLAASRDEIHYLNENSLSMVSKNASQKTLLASHSNLPLKLTDNFLSTPANPSDGFHHKAYISSAESLQTPGKNSLTQLHVEPERGYLKAEVTHSMKPTKSSKHYSNCKAEREAVEFLVESSTAAIDDGYVWLKYGQKKIKNKIHPRSYFRCSHQNCPVKKQTEISTDEPGFVSFIYFDKHNHKHAHLSSKLEQR